MIQINCTNCQSLLQIDDAFAGGVCRCKHCGTIQTVPKRLKSAAVAASGNGGVTSSENGGGQSSSSKSLYQRRAAIDPVGSGTGLDDLAGIVASSGLSSSRLQKQAAPPAAAPTAGPAWDKKIIAVVASAGGVIVLLLGVIIFMAVRDRTANVQDGQPIPDVIGSSNSGGGGGGTGGGTAQSPPGVTNLPNFLGVTLSEPTVAYVMDRGYTSREGNRLDLSKAALLRSVRSLGPERRFQVVFWGIGKEAPKAWPEIGAKPATPENISLLQNFLNEEFYSYGATEPESAVNKALKAMPEAVVLVPNKPVPTDQAQLLTGVLRARSSAGSGAKFYCFSLDQPLWKEGLAGIAKATGGTYQDVPMETLNRYAGQ